MTLFYNLKIIRFLITSEYVTGINPILNIIQTSIVAVGNDGMALCLESFEIVLYSTAKEGAAFFQGWLVDNDFGAFCLNTLHDALDGRLAKVIAV